MARPRRSIEELGEAAGPAAVEFSDAAEEARFPDGLVQERVEVTFPFQLDEPPTDEIPTRVKMPKGEDVRKESAKDTKRSRPMGRRNTAAERDLADIGESLEEKFAVIFGLAASLAPVTATYGVQNSPKAINALLDIAKRRPAVLRALTTVADGANALEIAKFTLGLLACIQVDTGRLNGDELPARAFGVTDIMVEHGFLQVVDEQGNLIKPQPNPNVTQMKVPDAVRFNPL